MPKMVYIYLQNVRGHKTVEGRVTMTSKRQKLLKIVYFIPINVKKLKLNKKFI